MKENPLIRLGNVPVQRSFTQETLLTPTEEPEGMFIFTVLTKIMHPTQDVI